MLAPLKGKAAGQLRPLAGNLVDAPVTLRIAMRMLKAKDKMEACLQLNWSHGGIGERR
jgi:hypothetical protein